MSQNVPLSKQTLIRLPKIKYGLLHRQPRTIIGTSCNVTEKTIDRDIGKWVLTPDFMQWLRRLWLEYEQQIDDKELVFKELSRIMGRTATRRIEEYKHEIITETVNINVSEDEDTILSKAASILNNRLQRKEKPESLH